MKNVKRKKATIDDVALAAGVSKATVSRYINGKTNLMSEKTKDKIEKVISLMDYHPSDVARNLKLAKSNTVGVVIADIQSPFSASAICGIEETLNANGYTPLFMSCDNNKERELQAIESLVYKKVDGLIVNAVDFANNMLISLAADSFPIVLLDRDVENYNFNLVTVDNVDMLNKAVYHLQKKGYTKLAYFTEPIGVNSVRMDRAEEFKKAYKKLYGTKINPQIFEFDNDNECESQLKKFIRSKNKGDNLAIVCINSSTTLSVYRATRRLNISIPNELGLIGPDDWDLKGLDKWTELFEAPITSLRFSSKVLGSKCAELLVKKIDDPESAAEKIMLKSELVERESTNLRIKKLK